MKTNKKLYRVVLAALFAAMIFVLTFFVKFPTLIGYIHLGGYGVYVPVTMAVKMLLALCFTNKGEKFINVRNLIAVFICCGITVFGYFAFEIFYYGAAAYASMLPNLLQAGASGVLYIIVGIAFNKADIKSRVTIR